MLHYLIRSDQHDRTKGNDNVDDNHNCDRRQYRAGSASELSDYLADNGMKHTRGRPYHPQTQGKIERWHRSMKNQILLENYYLPGELKAALQQFVGYYNHERYHESLNNLTPADVFYGRGSEILDQREKIKRASFAMRRKMHYDNQARQLTQMS